MDHVLCFNVNVGSLFSGVYENHAMLSRELCLSDLVVCFEIYVSGLLTSAYIVRGVFVYKVVPSQVLRRVGILSDLFSALIGVLSSFLKNRTKVTFRIPHILVIILSSVVLTNVVLFCLANHINCKRENI